MYPRSRAIARPTRAVGRQGGDGVPSRLRRSGACWDGTCYKQHRRVAVWKCCCVGFTGLRSLFDLFQGPRRVDQPGDGGVDCVWRDEFAHHRRRLRLEYGIHRPAQGPRPSYRRDGLHEAVHQASLAFHLTGCRGWPALHPGWLEGHGFDSSRGPRRYQPQSDHRQSRQSCDGDYHRARFHRGEHGDFRRRAR